MEFAETRIYADPEKAARKLVEIANTIEPVQDGRIHIEKSTRRFYTDSAEAGRIWRWPRPGDRARLAVDA